MRTSAPLGLALLAACHAPPSGTETPAWISELAREARRPAAVGSAAVVRAPARARGPVRTFVIDVSDLLYAPPSFIAPELDVFPSGYEREYASIERGAAPFDEALLLDAIRAAVAPGTWDDGENSLEIVNGKLYVRHD